jgi:hypothetical protein
VLITRFRAKRQVLTDPGDRGSQAGIHVAAVPAGLNDDQREDPLAVGVAVNEVSGVQFGEARVELSQSLHHPVVREQAAVLQEWVGIGHHVLAGAGVADVGDEGRAVQVAGCGFELCVLPRGERLLVHRRRAVGTEHADAGADGVAVTLRGQAVLGVEEPEGGWYRGGTGVQAEQPAHPPITCRSLVF